MGDFKNNIGMYLEIHGAKKVLSTMKKLKSGMIGEQKANQTLFGNNAGIKNIDRVRSGLNKTAKQQKDGIALLKKQNKLGAERASTIDKEFAKKKKHGQFLAKQQKFQGKEVKTIDDFTNSLKNSAGTMKSATKDSKRFKMEYLGIMFAGMALDRVMSGLFKGMTKTYKEFTKEAATPLGDSIIGLEANWKFLKFTMMETMSGILKGGLDWIAGFIRAMSKWDPNLLKGVGIGLLAIAGAAKVFMIGGQIALGMNSLNTFIKNLKPDKLNQTADGMGNLATQSKKIPAGQWVLGGAIAIAAVVTTFQMFTDKKTSPLKRGLNMATWVAMGAWLGTSVFPGLGTLVGGIIGAVVGLVVTVSDMIIENMTEKKAQKLILESVGISTDSTMTGELLLNYNAKFGNRSKTSFNEYIESLVKESKLAFGRSIIEVEKEIAELDLSDPKALETVSNLRTEIDKLTAAGVSQFGEGFIQNLADIRTGIDLTNQKISEGLKTPMQELEETISPSDIVTSVKSLNDIDIEDFKTKLKDLKVPLLEFLSSFLGKEGLLVSLTDLLSKTMDYVVYIPSLVEGLATEGESVDYLTSKYNALADAKDRLRSSLDAIHHANSGSVNPNTL